MQVVTIDWTSYMSMLFKNEYLPIDVYAVEGVLRVGRCLQRPQQASNRLFENESVKDSISLAPLSRFQQQQQKIIKLYIHFVIFQLLVTLTSMHSIKKAET